MKKIDELIHLLLKIYLILQYYYERRDSENYSGSIAEQQLTRQEVKDYLGISESTYKRKVKDGSLKPMKMPGGDRYFKHQLLDQYRESKRRGRV